MKVENGKIIEATDAELFEYWLRRGYDDIYTYEQFKYGCTANGTKIIEEVRNDGGQ